MQSKHQNRQNTLKIHFLFSLIENQMHTSNMICTEKCSLFCCKSQIYKNARHHACLSPLPLLSVQTKQRREFLSFSCSWISPDGILLVQSPIGILNILALCGKSPEGYFVSRLHTKCISSQSSKPAFTVANFLCLMVFILKGHFLANHLSKTGPFG